MLIALSFYQKTSYTSLETTIETQANLLITIVTRKNTKLNNLLSLVSQKFSNTHNDFHVRDWF